MLDRDPALGATDPNSVDTVAPASVEREVGSLRRDERVGEYRVVRLLGAGGMGEVYLAEDERLRREVAIKVVRPGASRDRLLREAQAMARLAHPNVVTVYEAGLVGEQVFIAMEFVAGATLRGWLTTARPWREVVRHFLEAGRGLAAAHAAGLVHRDFKPDNVLLGDDGRARVGDFGLAAPGDERDTGDVALDLEVTAGGEGIATQSRVLAGTPRYMAPEQHRGEAVDARTDQFAFCVSLWEALAGRPPFPGNDLLTLRAQAERGVPVEGGRPVPAWLRAIVLRGLRPDPQERFASMGALLDVLARDPAVRLRRLAAGAAVVALGAVAVLGWSRTGHGTAPCRGLEHRLDGVWDRQVAEAVRARFDASGRPYAGEAYARIRDALDAYATDWITMRKDACEATAVRHEQSAELLDRRMACLDRRASGLAGVSSVLAAATPDTVDHAVETLGGLAALGPCADVSALGAGPPPPPAALRGLVGVLHEMIDRASAYNMAGAPNDAFAAGLPAWALAESLGYLPLRAEALQAHGTLLSGRGDDDGAQAALEAGLEAASLSHDDRRAADIWTRLVAVVGTGRQRADEAAALIPGARAAVARAGGDRDIEATLDRYAGYTYNVAVRLDEAIASFHAAIEIDEQLHPDGHELAEDYMGLGDSLRIQGRFDESRAAYLKARQLLEHAYGVGHPRVAVAIAMQASLERDVGNDDASRADLDEALRVLETSLGPDHREVAHLLVNRAVVLQNMGDLEAANADFQRALVIQEKVIPDSPQLANTLTDYGVLLFAVGRVADALPLQERAVRIDEATLGRDHPQTGVAEAQLAQTLFELGRDADAELHAQRAQAILEGARGPETMLVTLPLFIQGVIRQAAGDLAAAADFLQRAADAQALAAPDHAQIAEILTYLGDVETAAGRPSDAVKTLEHALRIRAVRHSSPPDDAWTRFFLAKALWAAADHPRARTEAATARDEYPPGPEHDEIVAWLAKHR